MSHVETLKIELYKQIVDKTYYLLEAYGTTNLTLEMQTTLLTTFIEVYKLLKKE